MSAPDYAQPIHGWRVWRVVATREGLRLSSVIYDDAWEPRHEFRAACASAQHDAPARRCRCGIHAARSMDGAVRHLLGRNDPNVVHRVLGTVALWGRVFEGEHGWRAQLAYPVQLLIPDSPDARKVAAGLEAYSASVRVLGGVRVLDLAGGAPLAA